MTTPIKQECPALAVILPWWAGLDKYERRGMLRLNGRNWLRLDNDLDIRILGRIYARAHGIKLAEDRVGRNDPCICGSGRKFKKCCMA